ncbi:gluzincin family metallopeptidase [Flavihumibacter profundi]|uniref:hypothetical protein n=1 Tax=Flavihumibacter profundi TaxID=2716883 RepID=UPI001CC5BDB0|nr:hypothetical protein [Flavihumibacter profundi]MBZ5856938.1 hypothetical protein [Flavihumibacter profundi]
MGKKDRVFNTAHFKIYYTVLDDSNIKEIADSLENGYPKITSHLQSGDLPVVNVHYYKNIADLLKVFPGFPIWAVGQAISVSEIHMISPNDTKQDYQTMIRNTKHEFAHCVSMKINSTIGNNPRWLWESIALYEANFPWDPHMLPYLVSQKPPTLNELNDLSDQKIYEVGYFIAQFIAETYGTNALKSLIQNNGNLKDTLKMDDEEFTKKWFAFVSTKYGIVSIP